jgi:alkanesulfonate monooxygenase SsuD/methylene tetrahydromethanopterin reductase-like flavin-dependent oxidoreductase (luciferase family)
MDFSIWTSNERQWDEVLALTTWAAETGWHGYWYADHIMSQTPDDTAGTGAAHECWTVLAAVAATVPRLTLTSMVSPVTIHPPVVLAKRAATVDAIAPGRVVLGLGAGWQVNEHREYGFELPAPGERVTRFESAIEHVHQLLHDESLPFAPRPASLPLLVGTGSPRMMRITARWADRWNTWGDPAEQARRGVLWEQACAAAGRDPRSVHRSAQAMVFLTDSDATRDKLRSRAPEDRSLVGGPSELIDLLGQYVAQGIDEFAVPDFTLGSTPEQRRHTYERLLDEVIRPLQQA